MGDNFWAVVSYVQMSENRRKVVRLLREHGGAMTPTELADELAVVVKTASRAVRQLNDNNVVTCINPDAARDRAYRLTDTGQTIARVLEHLEAGTDGDIPASLADITTVHTVTDQDPTYDVNVSPEAIIFVRLSPVRKSVMQHLAASTIPLTPSELHDAINAAYNSVSRALRQLEDHDMVYCMNPDAPRYRRYHLTTKGKAVWHQIDNENE